MIEVAVVGTEALAVSLMWGIFVGVLARAVLTRLFASLRYVHLGLPNLPENWFRLMFKTDFLVAPELLPGEEEFSFANVIKGFSAADTGSKLIYGIALPIWFLPALLYRYALKSNF